MKGVAAQHPESHNETLAIQSGGNKSLNTLDKEAQRR